MKAYLSGQRHFLPKLKKALEASLNGGLLGHGYEAEKGRIEALKIFMSGGLRNFLETQREICPEFHNEVQNILHYYNSCLLRKCTKGVWGEDYSFEWRILTDNLRVHKRLYAAYGSNMDKAQMASQFLKELFLQFYFGANIDLLSNEQKLKLKNIIGDKYSQKKGLCDDYIKAYSVYNVIQSKYGEVPRELIPDNILNDLIATKEDSGNLEDGFSTTALTPNWGYYAPGHYFLGDYTISGVTASYCYEWANGEFTEEQIAQQDDIHDAMYYSMFRSFSSTVKFNCHSYSWISSATYTNKWCLNDPSYFYSLKTYVGSNCGTQTGDLVVLYYASQPVHSVRVTTGGSNSGNMITRSKMGAYGVYTGTLTNMMAAYSCTHFYVYR